MNPGHYTDEIALFLSGRMLPEDQEAFQEKIEKDPKLKEEVRKREIEQEVMRQMVKKEYKEKIKGWMPSIADLADEATRESGNKPFEKEIVDKFSIQPDDKQIPTKSIRKLYYTLSIAAGVLLLMGIGTYVWLSSNYSNQGLIAQHYVSPDKDLLNLNRSPASPEANENFEKGKAAYLNAQYPQAAQYFSSLGETDEQALYFLAHSRYKAGNYAAAIDVFEKVSAMKGRFEEKAEYFQLLSYLANNDLDEEFQALLDDIATNEYHSFHKQAQAIKKDLNSIWRKWVK